MSGLPDVLYIDDESDLLDLAESFLTEEGLAVSTTASASNAIELFKKNNYKIIISDARMPEMTGHDLLTKLKSEFNFNGHFILVTGDDGLIARKIFPSATPHLSC